jgi:uncharacterized protein (DUF2235 family)
VGTFSAHPVLTKPAETVMRGLGNGFGLGLTANVEEGYRFLMAHYERGDRVFLFGFSRGAFTARALAGMLYRCGLLPPGNENLIPYATRVFKGRSFDVARGFKKTFGRPCGVHFLGLWDTVKSVGWVWDAFALPYTTNHPSVRTLRHAVSIDERRAFFRQNLYGPPKRDYQDYRQVWFPGVHCDVGGSYPPEREGLSRIALEWMLVEAYEAGLRFDGAKAVEAVKSSPPLAGEEYRVNRSLTWKWYVAEVWPKLNYSARYRRRYPRLNAGRARSIAEGAVVHESVYQKMRDDAAYRPPNLPPEDRCTVEPWRRLKTVLRETRGRRPAGRPSVERNRPAGAS